MTDIGDVLYSKLVFLFFEDEINFSLPCWVFIRGLSCSSFCCKTVVKTYLSIPMIGVQLREYSCPGHSHRDLLYYCHPEVFSWLLLDLRGHEFRTNVYSVPLFVFSTITVEISKHRHKCRKRKHTCHLSSSTSTVGKMAMFCSSFRGELENWYRFCSFCGTPDVSFEKVEEENIIHVSFNKDLHIRRWE